jgi:hypothetical protein
VAAVPVATAPTGGLDGRPNLIDIKVLLYDIKISKRG